MGYSCDSSEEGESYEKKKDGYCWTMRINESVREEGQEEEEEEGRRQRGEKVLAGCKHCAELALLAVDHKSFAFAASAALRATEDRALHNTPGSILCATFPWHARLVQPYYYTSNRRHNSRRDTEAS